jgi:hypothetical protein
MTPPSDSGVDGLKPCKRYIATHNQAGKSVYAESPDQVYNRKSPEFGGMSRSYAVNSIPAKLADDADIKAYKADSGPASYAGTNIVVTPGANLVVVDLKPGACTGMHRTVSIDFSICVIGEIEHELDSGATVRLLPGVSAYDEQVSRTYADGLGRIISSSEVPCESRQQ